MKLLWDAVQSPKPRFDPLLVGINWQIQILVKISVDPHPIVSFVYGVKQIDDYDGDVYPPSVLEVFGRARLRFGITSSYCDAVV